MKNILLLPFVLFGNIVFAQPQLENAGYEDWTDLGDATEEPGEWSSVKTSDGGAFINGFAPQLCWQSTDAHTGAFSVNLRTVNSAIGAASGLLTNGRVHAEFNIANSYVFSDANEEQWRTVCGSRPDSLMGWFKSAPQPGDFARITALMHVGEGKLPQFDTYPNWVGSAMWTGPSEGRSEWTRFSVPFNYIDDRTPEYVLLAMSCGDSTNSIIGTEAWFDDMGLMYNVYTTPDSPIAYVNAGSGFDLNVAYTTGGEPIAMTEFAAELSDANGDFTSATVIGSNNSVSSDGSIPCTIPAGTIPSADYRIRVITSSMYYAPVDAGIIVEVNTAIAQELSLPVLVRYSEGKAFMDLRGKDLGRSNYQLFDARGAMVGSGSLQNGALNPLPTSALEGMLVLRVVYAGGSLVQRVMLP